jgi:YVTN family beta-propeller protein
MRTRFTLVTTAVLVTAVILIISTAAQIGNSRTSARDQTRGFPPSATSPDDSQHFSELSSGGLDRGLRGADSPVVGAVYGKVTGTISLSNGSLLPGNVLVSTCAEYSELALASDVQQLFVTCDGGGGVITFNTTTGAAEQLVRVGQDPLGLVYDPFDSDVYVANNGSNNVSVIATSDDSVVATIPVGGGPDAIAYDASNLTLFTSDWRTGNITEISTQSKTVIREIGLGSAVELDSISYNAINQQVYAAEGGKDAVAVISAETGSVSSIVSVGGQPLAIASDPVTGDEYVAVYVATNNSDTVSVISGATSKIVANISVGFEPDAITVSPSNDTVYVSNAGSDNISIISGSTNRVVGSVGAGDAPEGIAYDNSSDTIYVANYLSSDVSEINGSTYQTAGILAQNAGPLQLAWDNATDSVYVTDQFSGDVKRIASGTDQVSSGGPIAYGLTGIAADTTNGHLYASCMRCDRLFDLSMTGAPFKSIPVGLWPDGVALDSLNGRVYTANILSNNVSVVSSSNDSSLGAIPIPGPELGGGGPVAITFDSMNGDLYVAIQGCVCLSPGNVTVVNGATDSVMGYIQDWAQPGPSSLVIDPLNHELYVTDSYANLVWVFNASTWQVISMIPVGAAPEGIAVDTQDGDLFVTNSASNNVTVINDSTNRVVESIPVGVTPWGVAFDLLSGDVFVANEGSGTLSIIHEVPEYRVTFNETGLQAGTNWSVKLGGIDNSTDSSTIEFSVVNGTYAYSIGGLPGWHLTSTPRLGNISINGSAVTMEVAWMLTTYVVLFSESGLPLATSWSVTMGNVTVNTTTTVIGFDEGNGTYPYSVNGVPGWHLATFPRTGLVPVNASSVNESLDWIPTTYALSFTEEGLPDGSNWSVMLDGSTENSSSGTITFEVPNGSYTYHLGGTSASSYAGHPASGTVNVSGQALNVTINFDTSMSPVLSWWPWALVAGVGIIGVGTMLILLLGRRRRGQVPTDHPSIDEPR